MAKAVADTNSKAENAAGFVSDASMITGFSHMHDSGTGGSPSLGNFPLFVHPSCPEDDFAQCKFQSMARAVARKRGSARASPGYFAVELENGVAAEMTTTQHAALYRFTFPTAEGGTAEVPSGNADVPYSPLVLVELADLAMTRSSGGIQVDEDNGRIVGEGTFRPSFGIGSYGAFFCADFQGARIRRTGIFGSKGAVEEPKHFDSSDGRYGSSVGAWIQFEPPSSPGRDILARVGVSFLSPDQACANAESEMPNWDFNGTILAAQDAWREKLSPVSVDATGVSVELQTTFWSGLYRALLSPQNYTGENQKWESNEPYFDS